MNLYRGKSYKSKKECAILFCCHLLNNNIIAEFKKLINSCKNDFDIILSYDNSKHNFKKDSRYKYDVVYKGIGKKLGYKSKSYVTIPEIGKKFPELYFSPEYNVLAFYLKNQNYKYYWRMDYDLRFNGNWNNFFKFFLKNDADLIGLYLKRYTPDIDDRWVFWNKIYPNYDNSQKLSIFFPLVRFSNRALRFLDAKYKTGIYGFCEVIVPTLLNLGGFKIQDIGKRWYDENTVSKNKEKVMEKKNKLFHPVGKDNNLRNSLRFKHNLPIHK